MFVVSRSLLNNILKIYFLISVLQIERGLKRERNNVNGIARRLFRKTKFFTKFFLQGLKKKYKKIKKTTNKPQKSANVCGYREIKRLGLQLAIDV